MEPRLKADEICRKMLYQIEWNAQPSTVKGVAKQCALIAVETTIQTLNEDIRDLDVRGNVLLDLIDYWREVKQEIDKL